jgi:hypothetical protein
MTHSSPTLHLVLAISAVAAFAPTWAAPASPPDVVFLDGKIATLDAKGSFVSAVAVKDGRFVAVGSTKAIRKLAGKSTRIVDLGGRHRQGAGAPDHRREGGPRGQGVSRAISPGSGR